jgi:hypothetical protein
MNPELEADYSDFLRFPEVPPPFVAGMDGRLADAGDCNGMAVTPSAGCRRPFSADRLVRHLVYGRIRR